MGTAIVCLSLVVVTGFVGQLSLAQMALAGFGAWAAGRLATSYGWPFLPAVLAGAAAAVPLGALVALPALRTRGINLAVLTFGLSVLVSEMVLGNAALTGGFDGTRPDPPTLFGLEIDALRHPGRYGLVVLAALTLSGLAVANLRRGRAGLRLLAVRGNERAAAALGVSVHGAKLYGFSLAAGIAGLGGTLLAFRSVTVNYLPFTGFASIQVVVIAVIGGIGYVDRPALRRAAGRRRARCPHHRDPRLRRLRARAALRRAARRDPLRQPERAGRHQRPVAAAAPRGGDVPLSPPSRCPQRPASSSPARRSRCAHLTVRFGGVVALEDGGPRRASRRGPRADRARTAPARRRSSTP